MGPNDGWFGAQIGVTDLAQVAQPGSLALGGGLTIGTVADNGFTFSGRMLHLCRLSRPDSHDRRQGEPARSVRR